MLLEHFTDIIIFYQMGYTIFINVHTKYTCYLGKTWYSQQNVVTMHNPKW